MREARQRSTISNIFWENLSMREILVMTSPKSVRPSARTDCRVWRWGGMTAFGDGSVWPIFHGGKSRGSVAFGNPRFSGGKLH